MRGVIDWDKTRRRAVEMLKKVASRHGLTCLLHEKPFAGVNGSGKHNNWSITTDDGINLLSPGKKPHENRLFLLVLAAVLAAVNKHADLLRESAANPGNDHRLGADEAPPAIISIFLGDQLEDVVEQIINEGDATHSFKAETLMTGVSTLPDFKKDTTDRNRTSPFAFTGNKFEFRAVGSGDSVASPNIVLNTIVAEQFSDICDELEKVTTDELDQIVHETAIENDCYPSPLNYYKFPKRITKDTDAEKYTFENTDDVLEVLVYGAAADILKNDVSSNYGKIYADRYNELKQGLDPRYSRGNVVICDDGLDF